MVCGQARNAAVREMRERRSAVAAVANTTNQTKGIEMSDHPCPGIHLNVPFETYLQWPVLSQTTLKAGRKSMAHLKAAVDGERVIEPTDDMVLGSALHTVFLEPEMAITRVVCWDGGARRGSMWKEFQDEHAGKIILTEGQHAKLIGMSRSLRAHPIVREWVGRIEAVEVSCIGEIEDVLMKGRVDALTDNPLIDIKKVSDGDRRKFTNLAVEFGYHIQAAVYTRLFNRCRFILMTVEDQPPFDVVPYELSSQFIGQGEDELMLLLDQVRECQSSGVWPGRSGKVQVLNTPAWMTDEPRKLRIS
jgi:hypothetical protein